MIWITDILLCLGAICVFSGSIGMILKKKPLNKIHAASLSDTLGILLVSLGLILSLGAQIVTTKLILAAAITLATGTVFTHVIAKIMTKQQNSSK